MNKTHYKFQNYDNNFQNESIITESMAFFKQNEDLPFHILTTVNFDLDRSKM